MAVYVVTWNLNREGANYNRKRSDLIARLGRYDHVRDPNLETVYFVSTGLAVVDFRNDIAGALDMNDRLLISGMNNATLEGILIADVWDWIRARV